MAAKNREEGTASEPTVGSPFYLFVYVFLILIYISLCIFYINIAILFE